MAYSLQPLPLSLHPELTTDIAQRTIARLRLQYSQGTTLGRRGRKLIVIELAGMPRTGKTTLQSLLATLFSNAGYYVYAPPESASMAERRVLRNNLFLFNTLNAFDSVARIAPTIAALPHDLWSVIILDRGIADYLIWIQTLAETGQMSADEYKLSRAFFEMDRWLGLIDFVFCLRADPRVVEQRNSGFPDITGDRFTSKFLSSLYRSATTPTFLDAFKRAGTEAILIDTSTVPYHLMWQLALELAEQTVR